MTSEKQRPHGWNRGASKMTKTAGSCDGQRKARSRGDCKPVLAMASKCYQDLPSAYKGPYLGWWRVIKW